MKKILPLLLLASACLTSCGEVSVYGKYKFLLGRQGDDQTRVSLEMELLNEDSELDGYKKFNARFELSGVAGFGGEESLLSGFATALGDIEEILPISTDENGITTIPGYYQVQDLVDEKYGNKVKIAFNLGEDIKALFDSIELDPTELMSHFVVSYCNGSSYTFQLPVSLVDIQMQLCWYGFYFDYDPYLKDRVRNISDLVRLFIEGKLDLDEVKVIELKEYYDNKLPGEQDSNKRYGSHPVVSGSKNEVKEMNEKYKGLFSNTFVYENDEGAAGKKLGSIYFTEDNECRFFPLAEDYTPTTGSTDVIMKKDRGILDYDFSEETLVTLTTIDTKKSDGSYGCGVTYQGTTDDIDWEYFLQDSFVFRDYNDIKIELKKE